MRTSDFGRGVCFVVAVMGATSAAAAERLFWAGTYTGGPGKSEGIYVGRFNDATGEISDVKLAGEAKNPSFVALHPRLPMLYAVAEVAKTDGAPGGALLAFAYDGRSGMLTAKGMQPSGGAGPCHLTVDGAGKVVLAANYGGGSTICLGLEDGGTLQPVATGEPGGFVQHRYARQGEFGINARRQESPHAHSADVSPDGRFAVVCDLGLDEVIVYRLDAAKATLATHGYSRVAAGSGPRHFAFHPMGRFGYAVNELSLTVTAYAYDPEAGALAELQTISTLPADVTDRTGSSTAEIVAHPSGKFLYASNRGHDTIAMFSIDQATGKLTFLGAQPIEGAMPRNFAIDPSGRFLLAGGQNSNTISVFAIDQSTGWLTFTGHKAAVPSPVSIVFAKDALPQ